MHVKTFLSVREPLVKKKGKYDLHTHIESQWEDNLEVSFQEQFELTESFSPVFSIIFHRSLLDSGCGPIWNSGHCIYVVWDC